MTNNNDPVRRGEKIARRLDAEARAKGQVQAPDPDWDLGPEPDPGPGPDPDRTQDNNLGIMRIRPATQLAGHKQKRWLAKSRIPFGDVTVLVGDEGIGKSLFWVLLAAAITTGEPLPEFGIPARKPDHVILVLTEDDWSADVLPRLYIAGADISRVSVLCDSTDGSGSPEFPKDMSHVLDADPRPALVVVDAWLDTVDPRLRVRDGQQARIALHPWRSAATKTGAAVILLSHTNRLDSGDTRDLYGATAALRQKARMTLFAQEDGDGNLTVGPDKANAAKGGTRATCFQVRAERVFEPTDDSDGTVPILCALGQSQYTARQLAMANHTSHQDGDAAIPEHLSEFAEELRSYISEGDPFRDDDGNEWRRRLSNDVYKAAEACGASKDKAKRVKAGIGAVTQRDEERWYWAVPPADGEGSKGV